METQAMLVESQSEKLELINGNFSPTNAYDLISSLIENNINMHKLQYLSAWEKNHMVTADSLNKKVAELKAMKAQLKDTISDAKSSGSTVYINGTFNLEILK